MPSEKLEKNAKTFPVTKDKDGREWIEVEGRKYPKGWLLRHAARMSRGGVLLGFYFLAYGC